MLTSLINLMPGQYRCLAKERFSKSITITNVSMCLPNCSQRAAYYHVTYDRPVTRFTWQDLLFPTPARRAAHTPHPGSICVSETAPPSPNGRDLGQDAVSGEANRPSCSVRSPLGSRLPKLSYHTGCPSLSSPKKLPGKYFASTCNSKKVHVCMHVC